MDDMPHFLLCNEDRNYHCVDIEVKKTNFAFNFTLKDMHKKH